MTIVSNKTYIQFATVHKKYPILLKEPIVLLSPPVLESAALSLGWSRALTIGIRFPDNVRLMLFEVLVLELRIRRDGNGTLPGGVVC